MGMVGGGGEVVEGGGVGVGVGVGVERRGVVKGRADNLSPWGGAFGGGGGRQGEAQQPRVRGWLAGRQCWPNPNCPSLAHNGHTTWEHSGTSHSRPSQLGPSPGQLKPLTPRVHPPIHPSPT